MAKSAIEIAQSLRVLFNRDIPKTWNEYFDERGHMTAYEMTQLIAEQTKLSFEDAGVICAKINPELFAEYWDNLQATGASYGQGYN